MTSRLANFNYTLLPGRPWSAPQHLELYDKAFCFWEKFWAKTLQDLGLDRRKLSTDEFWRQDLMSLVTVEDEIVGMHMYTFFPVQAMAARRHSYNTRCFNEEFFTVLDERGIRSMMTMEFFAVHPEWRMKQAGVSLGLVLASLSCRVGLAYGVDVIVGSARADVPAAAIAYEVGAVPVVKDFMVNGCPTDLVAFYPENLTEPSEPIARGLADKLWRNRIDLSMSTKNPIRTLKSVA